MAKIKLEQELKEIQSHGEELLREKRQHVNAAHYGRGTSVICDLCEQLEAGLKAENFNSLDVQSEIDDLG